MDSSFPSLFFRSRASEWIIIDIKIWREVSLNNLFFSVSINDFDFITFHINIKYAIFRLQRAVSAKHNEFSWDNHHLQMNKIYFIFKEKSPAGYNKFLGYKNKRQFQIFMSGLQNLKKNFSLFGYLHEFLFYKPKSISE